MAVLLKYASVFASLHPILGVQRLCFLVLDGQQHWLWIEQSWIYIYVCVCIRFHYLYRLYMLNINRRNN